MTEFKGINILKKEDLIKIPKINGDEDENESYKIAGNIHKNIRYDIQKLLKPGASIYEISQLINKKIREYTNNVGVNGGIAFPPILSVSNCIAHFSPTKKMILN